MVYLGGGYLLRLKTNHAVFPTLTPFSIIFLDIDNTVVFKTVTY